MSKGRLQVGGVKLDMSWLNGGRWRRYLTVALLATELHLLYRVHNGEDEQEVVSQIWRYEDEQNMILRNSNLCNKLISIHHDNRPI